MGGESNTWRKDGGIWVSGLSGMDGGGPAFVLRWIVGSVLISMGKDGESHGGSGVVEGLDRVKGSG